MYIIIHIHICTVYIYMGFAKWGMYFDTEVV